MADSRLHDWLAEHGLADLGPILAVYGIERLEDILALGSDDFKSLGIPSGYMNRVLRAMGHRFSAADLDSSEEVLPDAEGLGFDIELFKPKERKESDGTIEFVNLNRAAATGGGRGRKPSSRGGRGRGRGRGARGDDGGGGADEAGGDEGPSAAATRSSSAELGPTLMVKTVARLTAFLEYCGLDECSAPLQEAGLGMLDDLQALSLSSTCLDCYRPLASERSVLRGGARPAWRLDAHTRRCVEQRRYVLRRR